MPISQPRNIWAVGRNYAEHARELGNAIPKEPLFFLKSGACLQLGSQLEFSADLGEIHYEIELALLLNSALEPSHFSLALDFTDRTAQSQAKAQGLPWTRAKSFIGACTVGDWSKFTDSEDFYTQIIELKINGQIRQSASLSQMIFKPQKLLKVLKTIYPLREGDLVLTGTPDGVGPLKDGDRLEARIGNATTAFWQVKLR